jgi:hypothetical protein
MGWLGRIAANSACDAPASHELLIKEPAYDAAFQHPEHAKALGR